MDMLAVILCVISMLPTFSEPGPQATQNPPSQRAQELIEEFNQEKVFWKQLDVAKEIIALNDPSVLPALEPWLSVEDRHQRATAALIFGRLSDKRGYKILADIVEDRSNRGPGQGIAGGRWGLGGQIRADRYYAVVMLASLKDPQAVPLLVSLLNDRDLNHTIVWVLGEIGDRSAIPALTMTLKNVSSDVRYATIVALQRLNAKEALPQIREHLTDDERIHFGKPALVSDAAKEAVAALEEHPR